MTGCGVDNVENFSDKCLSGLLIQVNVDVAFCVNHFRHLTIEDGL